MLKIWHQHSENNKDEKLNDMGYTNKILITKAVECE